MKQGKDNFFAKKLNKMRGHSACFLRGFNYFKRMLNSSQLKYWRVGVIKVATEEGSNLLSSKEFTIATKQQPTSRHLSTQH